MRSTSLSNFSSGPGRPILSLFIAFAALIGSAGLGAQLAPPQLLGSGEFMHNLVGAMRNAQTQLHVDDGTGDPFTLPSPFDSFTFSYNSDFSSPQFTPDAATGTLGQDHNLVFQRILPTNAQFFALGSFEVGFFGHDAVTTNRLHINTPDGLYPGPSRTTDALFQWPPLLVSTPRAYAAGLLPGTPANYPIVFENFHQFAVAPNVQIQPQGLSGYWRIYKLVSSTDPQMPAAPINATNPDGAVYVLLLDDEFPANVDYDDGMFIVRGLISARSTATARPLNDTGQTLCFEADALVACTPANTGDDSEYPRQDARFGRDAQAAAGQLTKVGAGAAGFDFTRICNSGQAAGSGACPANPELGPGANEWACTRDNVTGLIWEVKTPANANQIFTFAEATSVHADAVNEAQLCGANDWRVPTRRELLSIVHHGTSNPAIDTTFFPNTQSSFYWSSDSVAPDPAFAWSVDFSDGVAFASSRTGDGRVRLVRSGQ